MSGSEQEKLGERIMLCGAAILAATALAFVWYLALLGPFARHVERVDFERLGYFFLPLAVAATLIIIGGPIMLHGQTRKFRERGLLD